MKGGGKEGGEHCTVAYLEPTFYYYNLLSPLPPPFLVFVETQQAFFGPGERGGGRGGKWEREREWSARTDTGLFSSFFLSQLVVLMAAGLAVLMLSLSLSLSPRETRAGFGFALPEHARARASGPAFWPPLAVMIRREGERGEGNERSLAAVDVQRPDAEETDKQAKVHFGAS